MKAFQQKTTEKKRDLYEKNSMKNVGTREKDKERFERKIKKIKQTRYKYIKEIKTSRKSQGKLFLKIVEQQYVASPPSG